MERSDFGARQILRMHTRRTQNSVDLPTSLKSFISFQHYTKWAFSDELVPTEKCKFWLTENRKLYNFVENKSQTTPMRWTDESILCAF